MTDRRTYGQTNGEKQCLPTLKGGDIITDRILGIIAEKNLIPESNQRTNGPVNAHLKPKIYTNKID